MSLCRRPIHRIALAAKTGSFINKIPLKSFSQQNLSTQFEQTSISPQQLQLAGEEQHDDAIFKVFLKRVRNKTSSNDDPNEQNELPGESSNNDRGALLYSTIKIYQLKAGTLEKIVECITNDEGELDSTYMHILFSTYRTFTDIRTLLDTIINRYKSVLPASLEMTEDIRQKTLKSLRVAIACLLNSYKEDFNDPPCYSTLTYLLKHLPDKDIQNQGELLLDELRNNEENNQSDTDDNNNNNQHHQSKNGCIYNQKGFDYITPWNFLDMSSTTIAEQLTIVDADLLKRVLPYECLTISTNSIARRISSNHSLSTVEKTIEFFNAVVARVIATILKEQDEQIRANVIEKWIDVAHQCRKLKNFSSLTAILNGLSSGCIYRLTTAWSYVNEDYCAILEELKNIFGCCADKKQAREILDKQLEEVRLAFPEYTEGTAKYADVTTAINTTVGKKLRHKMKREQSKATMIGTIPYLGMYLSDLTYIDSAHPNTVTIETKNNTTEKLINFEKHRKEFEILAQIKLFQSAANAYTTLHSLPRFKAWFDNVRIYNDAESWELSYQIEPKETNDNCQQMEQFVRDHAAAPVKVLIQQFPCQLSLEWLTAANNGSNSSTQTTNDSLPPSPSLGSFDQLSLLSNTSVYCRQHFQNPQSKVEKNSQTNHSRSSSSSSYLTSSNGSSSLGYASGAGSPTSSSGNCTTTASNDNESIIAKIQIAGNEDLLYKKIRIRNNERTTCVLKTILEKFGLDPLTYERYCIEQRLPDRKILLLDHCNVYYALARSSDDEQVELIVREKTRQEREQTKTCPLIGADHSRTSNGLNTSSNHSR